MAETACGVFQLNFDEGLGTLVERRKDPDGLAHSAAALVGLTLLSMSI